MSENILIIGSGGREHSLEAKLRNEGHEVFVAPGNGGTSNNVPIMPNEFSKLADFAEKKEAFTVVGPEVQLVEGIVDYFKTRKLQIYGPEKGAAMIEGSKAYSKEFMATHKIPTARYRVVADMKDGEKALAEFEPPYVIKADGVAAGKGVEICDTKEEARDALSRALVEMKFGNAGKRVVIEEFLKGEEASYFVIADGRNFVPLLPAHDYKKRYDGDRGPNTGGMGAYAPHKRITPEIEEKIIEKIIKPTISGMDKDGRAFRGTLYAGLMLVGNEPHVLEFNCRFGDPETQNLMVMMKSELLPYLKASASGEMKKMIKPEWKKGYSINVVMASGGYPVSYETGKQIKGLDSAIDPAVQIFHAGTKREGNVTRTSGGRVLNVVAVGESIKTAREKVYKAIEGISWEGEGHRKDIGLQ